MSNFPDNSNVFDFGRIESSALGDRVHAKLEELIIAHVLPPNSRLVEMDLAKSFGVSRGPIRSAIQQLSQDGFVEMRPRQGATVREPTAKEIDDFYDIRRVLEGESARMAAARITPQGAERLRACIREAEHYLSRDEDPIGKVPDIHAIISEIADNKELRQYLQIHRKRSVWYREPFEPDRRKMAWEGHKRLVHVIIRGDQMAAHAAMITHIDDARARNRKLQLPEI